MSIQSTLVAVSPELAAAQEQLLQRRRQRRQERIAAGLPVCIDPAGRWQPSRQPARHGTNPPQALAPHFGWESEGFVRAERAAAARRARRAAYQAARAHEWPTVAPAIAGTAGDSEPARQRATAGEPASVRLYPDIALAMLREGVAATGRLWLLLQHLDEAGKGWVREADARGLLSDKGAPLRLCGWRQLRSLLAQGEGLFWQRDGGAGEPRIWLAGHARVALRLGVTHARLEPVSIPLATLLEGIGTVRAHFYASFHSSRSNHQRPIARATIAQLTAVSARSQRTYERVAGVRCSPNWVIGPAREEGNGQELAWQHGQALFTFTDRNGSYGPAGQRYLAWQLPNSYQGPHQVQGRSPQKALNEQLVDLYSKGMTGNDRQDVAAALPTSRFYDNGQAAARALNRGLREDVYWLTPQTERQYRIWHLLPAGEGAR
ncbi:MAG: hypothetical protein RRC07_04565 [Anaerolineae bacterium]|nr:hypothetical protein [Anaerolineae bacterium]